MLAAATVIAQQRQNNPEGPPTAIWEVVPAKSNIVQRGDVELLTFEKPETLDQLEVLYTKSQTAKVEPANLTTLLFRSPTDNPVQHYAIHLPKALDPQKSYPLVVQLHGLNFRKVYASLRTQYRGMGEQDILATTADAPRRYKVDKDRVYIMGHSMGSAG